MEDRRLLALITVDSIADDTLLDGTVTLREAVGAANCDCQVGDAPAGDGADTIQFAESLQRQTIVLNGNQLVVGSDLTILGPGQEQLTLDADGLSRHLEVNAGATLSMSGLTLTNGSAGEGVAGGSIYTDGTVIFTACTISNNRAGESGGAIYATASSPRIALTSCVVTGNEAVLDGGAIAQAGGTLSVIDSRLSGNRARTGGGVSAAGLGSVTIVDSELIENEASVHAGGVITGKELLLERSRLEQNKAAQRGGGVYGTGQLTVTNVMFVENEAVDGGAIFTAGSAHRARIVDTEFQQNSAGERGGALYIRGSKSVEMERTSFEDNEATVNGGAIYVLAGVVAANEVEFLRNRGGGGGAITSRGSLILQDSDFQGNVARFSTGGALHSLGPLTVTNSTYRDNTAQRDGGAISHQTGTLLVSGTTFEGNQATTGSGGAILNSASGAIVSSSFRSNQAADNGGAIWAGEDGFVLRIADSVLEANMAGTDGRGHGGAIWTNTRRLEITNTSIRGNQTDDSGGAILINEGFLSITDSLLASNSAINGWGGGVWAGSSAEVRVANSTVSGNTARQGGGGFLFSDGQDSVALVNVTVSGNRADAAGATGQGGGGIGTSSSSILLQNTLVAGNFRGTDATASDVQGELHPQSSYNLIGDAATAGGIVSNRLGNLVGVDPRLGSLSDNGGRLETHALLSDSPAIDAGNNSLALAPNRDPLWYDQRGNGWDRRVGLHVDIGAYEYEQSGGQISGRKLFDVDRDGTPDQTWGANLIVNGGFEAGVFGPDERMSAFAGSDLAGWSVRRRVDQLSGAWVPAEGSAFVVLSGPSDSGIIAQAIPTDVGRRYRVQFAISGDPAEPAGLKTLQVAAAGTSADFAFDSTGTDAASMRWETRRWEFVAQESLTIVTFEGLGAGTNGSPAIDNILVQPFGRDDVQIYLDQNNNSIRDASEPVSLLRYDDLTTPEDETGTYRFVGLPEGQYTVREQLTAGLSQVTPPPPLGHVVALTGAETRAGLNFLNRWDGEIRGTKFVDLNNNGARERNPLPADAPTVLMVLDVSDTTTAGFSIGDQNGDGAANILDAEVYAMLTLTQELINLGWGETAQVGVVAFASSATQLDMDPTAAGIQLQTTPTADADNDGVSDLEEVLRSISTNQEGSGPGNTDFEAALRATLLTLEAQSPPGDTVMFFVSDGLANNPWDLDDELVRLDELGVARTAWAVGHNSELADLRRIDPLAERLASAEQILDRATARSRNQTGDEPWLEPGLAGVTIYLDTNNNGRLDEGETSTITMADDPSTPQDETGVYVFQDLAAGEYVVREIVPDGYLQTVPKNPDRYLVNLSAVPTAAGYDFGNITSPGSISGRKGLDTDRDGSFEYPGEPYQDGVTVFLDFNQNGVLDAGEPTEVTHAGGTFEFSNLLPGTYVVREVVPEGFGQVFPLAGEGIEVSLDAGESIAGLLFVNQDLRGSISGEKWVDLNGNGQHEPNEPGLAGVRIYLDINEDGNWAASEPFAITRKDDPNTIDVDETGQWKIEHVIPGTYVVREVNPPGYIAAPAEGYTVTVGTLSAITGLTFFNTPLPPAVEGWKFNDLNGNGLRDRNRLRGDHLVLTVDVSDSTRLPFAGTPPGNLNDDNTVGDILDAEIAALVAVNDRLADGDRGSTSVSIVAFTNIGYQLDMNPAVAGVQLSTIADADADGDGVLDVEQVLRGLTREVFGEELRTDYASALAKTEETIRAVGTEAGQANVLFLSDGEPNDPNNYEEQVARLRDLGVNLSALGAGQNATLYTLRTIDPEATWFQSSAELLAQFQFQATQDENQPRTGSADGRWLEPGLAGVVVYIDSNNNRQLDWTDFNSDGSWSSEEGERWTFTQEDDPTTADVDETGRYHIDNLLPGNHILREVSPFGWEQVLTRGDADESLVAYFPFGGDLQDQISGEQATSYGAVPAADRLGNANAAYSFDGLAWMRAELANLPVGNAPRAMSVWVRSADGQQDEGHEYIAAWGAPQAGEAFGTAYFGNHWRGYLHGGNIGTGVGLDTDWHHLVITYDGSVVTMFVDGQSRGAAGRDLDTAAEPLLLGIRPDRLWSSTFDGLIDDVRIFDRSLSRSEVATLFAWEANRAVLRDGGYSVLVEYGDSLSGLNFANRRLQQLSVSSFTPTETGFVAQFDEQLDTNRLNLYETPESGPADVVIEGQTTGPVNGSFVVEPSLRTVSFIRTGGPLLPDTYTVSLRSGTEGFVNVHGRILDGDGDRLAGDDFSEQFVIAPPADAITIAIPDLVRGPGQEVHLPSVARAGIPVTLSDAEGVRSVAFQVEYDSSLLTISGASVTSEVPVGANVILDDLTPGLARLTFFSPTPLASGPQTFIRLDAAVPFAERSEIYGKQHILDIQEVVIRNDQDDKVPVIADDAFHLVSYFGDLSGNGIINASDAARLANFAALVDFVFDASVLADPALLGDISGNGRTNAGDAALLAQFAALIDVPEIPPIPIGTAAARIVPQRQHLAGPARPAGVPTKYDNGFVIADRFPYQVVDRAVTELGTSLRRDLVLSRLERAVDQVLDLKQLATGGRFLDRRLLSDPD